MFKSYFDPKAPGSFGGVEALRRQLLELTGEKKTRRELRDWLKEQNTYTLHKPLRRKFKTNRTVVYTIDEQFQADLVDMQQFADDNDGYKYLLTCIDIFSKYAWVIPLKDKTGRSVRRAFEKIFAERTPEKLQTDQGKEFENAWCKQLYNKLGINHFNALSSDAKCAVVERFNRTFKDKMWKYFDHVGKRRYIDVLDDLVYSYNNTWHSAIKRKPVEVNEGNVDAVWKTLFGKEFTKDKKLRIFSKKYPKTLKFKKGDYVRISIVKFPFRKGYENRWTEEIYTIYKVHTRTPPVYEVKDDNGEVIRGKFYEPELQLVGKPEWFVVEDIEKERGVGKKKEYYVKFRGYPASFNRWIPSRDVRLLT